MGICFVSDRPPRQNLYIGRYSVEAFEPLKGVRRFWNPQLSFWIITNVLHIHLDAVCYLNNMVPMSPACSVRAHGAAVSRT